MAAVAAAVHPLRRRKWQQQPVSQLSRAQLRTAAAVHVPHCQQQQSNNRRHSRRRGLTRQLAAPPCTAGLQTAPAAAQAQPAAQEQGAVPPSAVTYDDHADPVASPLAGCMPASSVGMQPPPTPLVYDHRPLTQVLVWLPGRPRAPACPPQRGLGTAHALPSLLPASFLVPAP